MGFAVFFLKGSSRQRLLLRLSFLVTPWKFKNERIYI
jgi:hypothetical protein